MKVNLPSIIAEPGLSAYIKQISGYPILSPENEYMLAKRVLEHEDVKAAHDLVTSHLRLVVKLAMKMRGYGVLLMDLISEGNLGLMHAVKKFNPDLGCRLSTYAMWWIKAAMQEFVIKTKSLVKIGTTIAQKKLFFNLNKIKNKIEALDRTRIKGDLSTQQTTAIATQLHISEKDVTSMDRRMFASDISLDSPIDASNDHKTLLEIIADQRVAHDIELSENDDLDYKRKIFSSSFGQLNPREQDVITSRHLKEETLTLDDLSKKYKVSRERVRQIEARAMEKITAYCAQHYSV